MQSASYARVPRSSMVKLLRRRSSTAERRHQPKWRIASALRLLRFLKIKSAHSWSSSALSLQARHVDLGS
jgi:hypothetical protein